MLDKNAEPVIDPSVLKLAQPISIDYTEYLKFKNLKEKPKPKTLVVSRKNHSDLHANYYNIVREDKQKDQFQNHEYTDDERKAILKQMKLKNRMPVGATEQNRKIIKWERLPAFTPADLGYKSFVPRCSKSAQQTRRTNSDQ